MASNDSSADGLESSKYDGQTILSAIDTLVSDQNMSVEEKQACTKWLREQYKRCVGIFVTGRTGVGKSTLLNALIGKNIFPVGDDVSKPCTAEVESHEFEIKGAKFKVWDCPGLQDGTTIRNQKRYLGDLRKECSGKADLMLYCIDFRQPRSANEFAVHSTAIEKITAIFGKHVWVHTVIVLTRANTVMKRLMDKHATTDFNHPKVVSEFNATVQEWKEKFQEALITKAKVSQNDATQINIIPAGLKTKLHLPGREYWYSDLWAMLFLSATQISYPSLLALGSERFKEVDDHDSKSQLGESGKPPTIFLTENVKRALIQVAGGSAVGAAGAGVGALIGALAFGVPTFGLAAGLGIGIGGVAGFGVGTLAGLLVNIYRNKHSFKCTCTK